MVVPIKGKGKAKGGGKSWEKKEEVEEEVELEVGDDDDDDDENAVLGDDDDEEWLAFQSAVLKKLVEKGTLSTGKLGHELGAKKKPVCAALFSLAETGMVDRTEGIPPKWTAKKHIDLSELVDAPISDRFLYDADTKKRSAGPKSSRESFETLKLLVRSHLGGNGATAGALGYKLNATKKVINAALYACEKEGTAWTMSDPESGTRLRWGGVKVQCNSPLPPCFAYGGAAEGGEQQPVLKRARTVNANATTSGDPFEDMKMVSWCAVAAAGESGITSGRLGYELNADRKSITASLYQCANEGKVQNISAEGMPKWVALMTPPASAATVEIPERFGYKGTKAGGGAAAVVQVKKAVAKAVITAPLANKANMVGLTPKQQAALAKKGGGKGAAAVMPAVLGQMPAVIGQKADSVSNPVAIMNEWAQKSKKALTFSDVGQDQSGEFLCQCSVDGQEVCTASARNKKQAKANAATSALEALGLA